MNWSWSVLVLALMGAEDQQPSKPKPPSSAFTVEIKIGGPQAPQAQSGCKVTADAAQKPADTKLKDLCADCCMAGSLDETTQRAQALVRRTMGSLPENAKSPGSSPLMKMPKVAKPRTVHDPEAQEAWPMTLRDAIRIALDNSEIVRVIAFGAQGIPIGGFEPTALKTGTCEKGCEAKAAPIVISRLNADANLWRFKAEVMAEVRSVEQQYWNLAQAHVQLWAADRAVSMAKEILEREQAELQVGRGTVADVAEAAQRLEQFKLDLVTRTSDVITTERQLRNLLGLPPADNRRIIPVTQPTEARLEPDWDSSLAQMLSFQPDIVQQQALVRVAELQLLLARNQLLPQLSLNALDELNGLGQQLDGAEAIMLGPTLRAIKAIVVDEECLAGLVPSKNTFLNTQIGYCLAIPGAMRSPLANTRQAQYILLRSRAYLQQVIHQTTHSLARFFLEIDANYKQFKTASRLRAAAAERLDAQRAYYEEGRITIDRFLDAVSQYTTAVATEAQYKTTYNIAIVALEEAKGTLLAYDNITVEDRSRRSKSWHATPAKEDGQAKTTAFEPEKSQVAEVPRIEAIPEHQTVTEAKTTCCDAKTETACTAKAEAPAKTKTWTFSISIGGPKAFQIKGTITAADPDEPDSAGH